ncbi:MAG: glycosyltransferase family 9 protein [Caulobacterales bacterium]
MAELSRPADAAPLYAPGRLCYGRSVASLSIPRSIILSRQDNIGDAVVTLPMAGWIKHHSPRTRITALVRAYTSPIWRQCRHIDEVLAVETLEESGDVAAIARLNSLHADAMVVMPEWQLPTWVARADIPQRVGKLTRWRNFLTCNIRPHVPRRGTGLHEAQLAIRLLAPFGIPCPDKVQDLWPFIGLSAPAPAPRIRALLDPARINVVVHPMADRGMQWGLENFSALLEALDPRRYHCLVTGTAKEAGAYQALLPLDRANVTDTGGALDLEGLMQLIGAANGLVACSTGPLHLAAAFGLPAIGLYSARPARAPSRWGPIGPRAAALVFDEHCPDCARGARCDCIRRIAPARVVEALERALAPAVA